MCSSLSLSSACASSSISSTRWSAIRLKTTRCCRRASMKPHQRRQARWFETFGCGTPSRCTSSPTESSPSSRSSSRIRRRVGSPSPRKYFATRSASTGASGKRNGASSCDIDPPVILEERDITIDRPFGERLGCGGVHQEGRRDETHCGSTLGRVRHCGDRSRKRRLGDLEILVRGSRRADDHGGQQRADNPDRNDWLVQRRRQDGKRKRNLLADGRLDRARYRHVYARSTARHVPVLRLRRGDHGRRTDSP